MSQGEGKDVVLDHLSRWEITLEGFWTRDPWLWLSGAFNANLKKMMLCSLEMFTFN